MHEIARENLRIVEARWPSLAATLATEPLPTGVRWVGAADQPSVEIEGHRLWSAYDADREAALQAARVPQDASGAWLYGFGGGDLARALLARPGLRVLRVVLLNRSVARFLLEHLDHRDWLSDPRVSLLDAAEVPEPQFPFAVVPGCLSLAGDSAKALADRLRLELDAGYIREREQLYALPRRKQIESNMALLARDGDVATLFGTRPGGAVFVAAAGPTLTETASWIARNRDRGLLIAVDAALRPLKDAGITPDVVVTIDWNRDNILAYFAGDLSPFQGTKLVYFPVVHHDVLSRWPGPRLAALSDDSRYAEVRARHPKASLYQGGSVLHPSVDLAVRTGAATVALFGCDLAFPAGRAHANANAPPSADRAGAADLWVHDGHGRRVPTIGNLRGYLRDLERYIAAHPQVEFLNSSRSGARIEGTDYLEGA